MKKLFLSLFLVFACVTAQAQQVDLKTLQALAEQGNAEAQYNLGLMYANGYPRQLNNSCFSPSYLGIQLNVSLAILL